MSRNYKILIADDEPGVREFLTDLLEDTFYVETIERGDEVLETVHKQASDILILDMNLPGMSGIEILQTIKNENINVVVVVITASNDLQTAVTAMKLGAYDYLVKPFDNEKFFVILKNIVEKLNLKREINLLREQVSENFRFKSIIGSSQKMQDIFETLDKVVDTDSTILVIGESGTGKGVIARAIHYNSNRSSFPFRSIDCSTLPEDLIASELFGHEKGAFTGAISRKIGKFEVANNGTLFLDEIGNLSLDIQAKLLKVLQEKEFERIGGNQIIQVNTRIVAASNRDLREMVKEGTFREDLYYRLNVVPVYLPILRDRHEDIPLFINFFLEKFNKEYERNIKIDFEGRLFLARYSWPGNVRQLENMLRRVVLLSQNDQVNLPEVKQLIQYDEQEIETRIAIEPEELTQVNYYKNDGHIKSLDEVEKELIEEALVHFDYNITITAKSLNVSRKTMHNKMKKYSIVIDRALSKKE